MCLTSPTGEHNLNCWCLTYTVYYTLPVVVKHFCNSTTYIFKNDIELHKEFDNHYMNVAYHGCTNHRQILRWNL